MNIKSLLLGSAAAFAAVTGAQAADAIVAAEPEPMEYVRVCDAFGPGYFYIPGTETCLKIGGYVRFQVDFGRNAPTGTDWRVRTRADIKLQTKSSTDFGDLVTYMEFLQTNGVTPATNGLAIEQTYLKLGGFKAGYYLDWFDDGINGEVDSLGSFVGNGISYLYEGPVTAGLSLSQVEAGELGLEGKLGGKVDNFSAYIIGAYDWAADSYAIGGVISIENLGPGTFQVGGTYQEEDTAYFNLKWAVAATYKLKATDALTLTPGVQFSERLDGTDNWTLGLLTEYKITDGLDAKLNIDYDDVADKVGGWARLQRSF